MHCHIRIANIDSSSPWEATSGERGGMQNHCQMGLWYGRVQSWHTGISLFAKGINTVYYRLQDGVLHSRYCASTFCKIAICHDHTLIYTIITFGSEWIDVELRHVVIIMSHDTHGWVALLVTMTSPGRSCEKCLIKV
jgi:hypothetical protein